MKKLIFGSLALVAIFTASTSAALSWQKSGGADCHLVFSSIKNESGSRHYTGTVVAGSTTVVNNNGTVPSNQWATVSWTPTSGFVGHVKAKVTLFNGAYIADSNTVEKDLNCAPATPTPSPTATPTPTPTPTVTPTITPTPTTTICPDGQILNGNQICVECNGGGTCEVIIGSPTPTPIITETPTPTSEPSTSTSSQSTSESSPQPNISLGAHALAPTGVFEDILSRVMLISGVLVTGAGAIYGKKRSKKTK